MESLGLSQKKKTGAGSHRGVTDCSPGPKRVHETAAALLLRLNLNLKRLTREAPQIKQTRFSLKMLNLVSSLVVFKIVINTNFQKVGSVFRHEV